MATHLHRVGELVDALEHQSPRVDTEAHVLARHVAHRRAEHAASGGRRPERRVPGVDVGQGEAACTARELPLLAARPTQLMHEAKLSHATIADTGRRAHDNRAEGLRFSKLCAGRGGNTRTFYLVRGGTDRYS